MNQIVVLNGFNSILSELSSNYVTLLADQVHHEAHVLEFK